MLKGPLPKYTIVPLGFAFRPGINYLLNDDFLTLANPPLTSPRNAEPGPGVLTLVQTIAQYAISDGKLRIPSQNSGSAWTAGYGLYSADGIARVAGRALLTKINLWDNSEGKILVWNSAASLPATQGGQPHAMYVASALASVGAGGLLFFSSSTALITASVDHELALILRDIGALHMMKGGMTPNWKMVWIDTVGNEATLYPMNQNYSYAGDMDYFRLRDLGSPFDTDYGIASFHITSFTQSLGAELVTNGDFAAWTADNPDGWTVTGEVGADPEVTERAPANTHAGAVGAGGAANFYSSATSNQPRVEQSVLADTKIYEVSLDITAVVGGSILVIGTSGFSFENYSVVGTYKPLSRVAGTLLRFQRTGANPGDITIDNISAKEIVLNTAQVSAADAIHDFGFTVPVSPSAGQEVHLLYRIEAAGDEFFDCWDAYLRRNTGNTAWDFRLDSISAGTRTNRIAVTGVTADTIRVIVNGSLHDCYTKSGTTWTKRGAQINVSHLDHATGVNTVYSTGTTPVSLDSFPIRAASYDSALTLNPPTYLLLDRFYTSVAAPLAASRNSEPGPGKQVKSVDTNVISRISGGRIKNVGSSAVSGSDPGYYWTDSADAGFPRVAGRTLILTVEPKSSIARGFQIGWYGSTTINDANAAQVVYFEAAGAIRARQGASNLQTLITFSLQIYQIALVLLDNGYITLIKPASESYWKLAMLVTNGSEATLWPAWVGAGAVDYEIASIAVTDLGATFDSQADIATIDITAFTQSAGSELVTNGDFSAWTADNPDSWTVAGESGSDPMVNEVGTGEGQGGAGTGFANLYTSVGSLVYIRTNDNVFDEVGAIYEFSININLLTAGSILILPLQGGTSVSIASTGVKKSFMVASNLPSTMQIVRATGALTDVTFDDVSLTKLTKNTAQSITADSVIDFEFTLPASPIAGQEIHLAYRIQNAGEEFKNCWDAYLRRNDANNAWDFRLDSILAYTRTNRIAVTGVGTPDAIKVICEGSLHDCYTRASGVWTKRGAQVNVAHMDARTLCNTIYSTGTTATRLRAYPRTGTIDTTPLVNVTVDGQTLGAELLVDPGVETWTSPTDLTNWVEALSGTSTVNREGTDIHGGSFAVRLDIDSSNNGASISQVIAGSVIDDLWEVTGWVKSELTAKTFRFTSTVIPGATIALTNVYAKYGEILRAGQAGSSLVFVRTSATSSSIYGDDFSVKKITPNAPQVATADGVGELAFTLPVSPYVGQRIELRFRMQDYGNYWVAYLRRNDVNSAWDLRVDSVVASTVTNRITVTGVGTPNQIRIRALGLSIVAETGVSDVWTHRGVVSSNILQGAVLTTYVYNTGFTFGSLKHYRFIPAYSLLDGI